MTLNKNVFSLFLTFVLLCCQNLWAFSAQSDLEIKARILRKKEAEHIIDKKVLKKYVPVQVILKNNTCETFILPKDIKVIDYNGNLNYTALSSQMYSRTKRNLVLRAIIWGVLGGGLFSVITIPISIAHTKVNNQNLHDNIATNAFNKKILFENEEYLSFLFVPKNQYPMFILFEDIKKENEQTFNVKIPLREGL